jgi:hypothetical protein
VLVLQNPKPVPEPAPVLPPAPVQYLGPANNGEFGPTLVAAAFRYIEPTWRNYIHYVDLQAREGDADAKRYVSVYQSLSSKERNAHFPEQICDLANVLHADLISWVSRQFWIEGSARSSMVLSHMRDQVLSRTAHFAMDSPDNVQHAKLFLTAAGALPQSGRSSSPPVNIFNMPTSNAAALSVARSEESPTGVLRDMDTDIITLDRIMQSGDDQTAAMRMKDTEEEEEEDDDDESE